MGVWFWAALGFTALDWMAVWRGWRRRLWFFKPAVLVCLLLWVGTSSRFAGDLPWFGLALVFCLLGDIALLFPRRFFMAGMAAFLVGHIFFLAWLNRQPLVPGWQPSLVALVFGMGILWLMLKGWEQLSKRSFSRRVRIILMVYSLFLSMMVLSALLCIFRPAWPQPAAWLAAVGALFFLGSDVLLAYCRFIRSLPNGQLVTHITYHIAQFCLAVAALAAGSWLTLPWR